MSLKGKLEAIIYAAEEPVTLDQIATLLRDSVMAELAVENQTADDQSSQNTEQASLPTEPEIASSETASESAPEPAPADSTMPATEAPATASAETSAPEPPAKKKAKDPVLAAVKAKLRSALDELIADYASDDRGIEIRNVAGGYRMATKPEHHEVIVGFAKSLKPPIRLSLPALETLAVIAYKQPATVPEINEIRGVDSSGVIATLLDRKLITTAGRKQVIGRPMLYKTTKEFLLRFGLKDVTELPSMEEFEKLGQAELIDSMPESASDPPVEAAPIQMETPSEAAEVPSEVHDGAQDS